MSERRRINVFHRSDGTCVHDKGWDDDSVPLESGENKRTPPSPTTLWPLVQVFLQFSREVQGGTVKRLVFRNPEEYAPAERRFQPVPQRQKSAERRPIVVHVAHDDLFVVTVTEMHTFYSEAVRLVEDNEEQIQGLTMAEFCESVLDFANREQAAYIVTLATNKIAAGRFHGTTLEESEEVSRGQGVDPLAESADTSFLDGFSMNAMPSGSEDPTMSTAKGGTCTMKPMVMIDNSRLSEFITKTQNLMRM